MDKETESKETYISVFSSNILLKIFWRINQGLNVIILYKSPPDPNTFFPKHINKINKKLPGAERNVIILSELLLLYTSTPFTMITKNISF